MSISLYQSTNYFDLLDTPIKFEILKYLNIKELSCVRCLNKEWQQLALDPSLKLNNILTLVRTILTQSIIEKVSEKKWESHADYYFINVVVSDEKKCQIEISHRIAINHKSNSFPPCFMRLGQHSNFVSDKNKGWKSRLFQTGTVIPTGIGIDRRIGKINEKKFAQIWQLCFEAVSIANRQLYKRYVSYERSQGTTNINIIKMFKV